MQRTFRGVSLGSRWLAAAVAGTAALALSGCGSATQAASTAPITAVSTGPTPRFDSPVPSVSSGSAAAPTGSAPATGSAAAPTVPADVPLIGHNMAVGEKPPVEPVAALAHTQDGAIAFAKFWIQTLDWGYATTSTAYARHYIDPSCATCLALLGDMDTVAAKGQRYIGARLTITSASVAPVAQQNGSEQTVVVLTDITGAQIVDAKGDFVAGEQPVDGRPFSVPIKWSGGRWVAVGVGGA